MCHVVRKCLRLWPDLLKGGAYEKSSDHFLTRSIYPFHVGISTSHISSQMADISQKLDLKAQCKLHWLWTKLTTTYDRFIKNWSALQPERNGLVSRWNVYDVYFFCSVQANVMLFIEKMIAVTKKMCPYALVRELDIQNHDFLFVTQQFPRVESCNILWIIDSFR